MSPAQPWAWIARICQRECARLVTRRRDAELAAEPAEDAPSFEDRIVEQDAARSAVADLPAIDRELIELRYAHDQTYARIAELLDLPVGTVKVRLHRARLRLRDALANDSRH
jgi:RNA polymerase sigma factor (sigma-70 family)